jgi:hypothetical protein
MTDRIDEIFNQVMDEASPDPLRRFAELVRQDEREACAKLCDEWGDFAGIELAMQIRARGKK